MWMNLGFMCALAKWMLRMVEITCAQRKPKVTLAHFLINVGIFSLKVGLTLLIRCFRLKQGFMLAFCLLA